MKNIVRTLMIASVLFVSAGAYAQTAQPGYYVTETSKNVKETKIRFYNLENQLLTEQLIEGRRLSVARKKDRKFLDARLAIVLKESTIAKK